RPITAMGTGRRHGGRKKTTGRRDRRRGPRASRAERATLRGKLPKAGMVYPFDRALLRSKRGDISICTVVQRAQGVPFITSDILDTVFSHIFEEATKLQQESGRSGQFTNEPVAFIQALQFRPSLRDLWRRRNVTLFIRLFLVLRAARVNWHKNPRPPSDIEKHCKIARAIDAFLEIESLNWNNFAGLKWLVDGGREIMKPDEENDRAEADGEQASDDEDGDDASDSDDSLFVKRAHTVAMDEDMGEADGKQDDSSVQQSP
ncbi:hypothetical protein C8A01DRAFT_18672, partial [Parachaetomium inaequale]